MRQYGNEIPLAFLILYLVIVIATKNLNSKEVKNKAKAQLRVWFGE